MNENRRKDEKMKRVTILAAVAGCVALTSTALAQTQPVVGSSILEVKVNVMEVVASGYRASKLIGSDIHNEKDEMIGKVDDLIIAGDGKVSLAVINVGSFLGLGGKNVAIPTGLFKPGQGGKITLPGSTKEALKGLPEFKYAP